jgi:hypothetical protein
MRNMVNFSATIAIVVCAAYAQAIGAADAAGSGYKVGDRLTEKPNTPATTKPQGAQGEFKLTNWDELVPRDWNPLKDLQDLNLGFMQDGDPRAQQALDRLKKAWDSAPGEASMDNQRIRIAGFVVPLEGESGRLREFLLVPYFGACIHVPPPPANQIIHVTSAKPIKGVRAMDPLWVNGLLHIASKNTSMGTSAYRMEADSVAPYRETR